MNTSEIIKMLRIQNNMTQEELGERIGVKKSAIAKYESGRVENLKRSTIEKLANIFDVSPTYLLGMSNEKEVTELHFTDPTEAFKYILDTPLMMAYGGYDVRKMTNQELVDFANEIADYAKYIAERKYSKK